MTPQRFDLLVPGVSTSSQPVTVYAPFDRTPIGEVATADAKVVEHALATAFRLFRNRDAWLPAVKRIEILEKTEALLRSRAEVLATEAAREGGKPLIDSRVEVARAADSLQAAASRPCAPRPARSSHGR